MSEFKGTKSPWKAVNTGPHWNNKNIDNIQIQYGEDGECVSDHVYDEYDALLISKAPELLQLIQDIRDDREAFSDIRSWYGDRIDKLLKEATEL